MCHQLLHASSNGLDVVDDQLIEIRVLLATFYEESIANVLTRDVCVRLSDVCE